MKPRRERSKKRMRVMNLWNWSDVAKAVPYLHSIVGSLREHWLDVLSVQNKIDKAAALKGLPKRQQLIEEKVHQDERHTAQTKFEDALEELNQIDVFLLDPVRGLAMVPFRKEEDLAWYVFDHFTPAGVIGWRLHNDPIEKCRPLELIPDAAPVENSAT
jgi:hypothetical protein